MIKIETFESGKYEGAIVKHVLSDQTETFYTLFQNGEIRIERTLNNNKNYVENAVMFDEFNPNTPRCFKPSKLRHIK